jgi:glycosyltransferase involved in cell wall biosynthesis
MSRRPSVCYAAPGSALLGTAGTTRNMLSLAKALGRWADVTVAFRSILQPVQCDGFEVMAIEPRPESDTEPKDDVTARGLNGFTHLSYLRKLSDFSARTARSYDLVLEKGWRLSGFLSSASQRQGVPGVLVENDVRHWSEPVQSARAVAKYGAHRAAQCLAGFYSRRVPLIIAETEELKAMLVSERGVAPERIEVVGLGVDHDLFRPLDRASSRKALGVSPDAFVLLYIGGMDTYHDLGPVIDALAGTRVPGLELHLAGDGDFRAAYQAKASRARTPMRFHGQVPHDRVPELIAAADLCLAPYRVAAFPKQSVCFSTLKIPEYMACGRPVVSVPSGHIKKLIEDQVSGFLFANEVPCWRRFLESLPSRERLNQMGRRAAQTVDSRTWEKTAERYLEVCQGLVEAKVQAKGEAKAQIASSTSTSTSTST